MSYRRAWLLVDEMNAYAPPVETETGGRKGGGSKTPTGEAVIAQYRDGAGQRRPLPTT